MNDIDLFFIRFMAWYIGVALCFILSALYKRITVKRKKDELELKQRELSLK